MSSKPSYINEKIGPFIVVAVIVLVLLFIFSFCLKLKQVVGNKTMAAISGNAAPTC